MTQGTDNSILVMFQIPEDQNFEVSMIKGQDQRPWGFNLKTTYYIMKPCITTVYYTEARTHTMSCLAEVCTLLLLLFLSFL